MKFLLTTLLLASAGFLFAEEPGWTSDERAEQREVVVDATVVRIEKVSEQSAKGVHLMRATLAIGAVHKGANLLSDSDSVEILYETSPVGADYRCPTFPVLQVEEEGRFYLRFNDGLSPRKKAFVLEMGRDVESLASGDSQEGLAAALPKMVGKTAQELNDDHADLLSRFRDANQHESAQPTPWHVWHYANPANEDRYILFSGQPLFAIPGTSCASIRLFSGAGEQLGFWRFSTGWRIDLKTAKFEIHKLLDAPTITIATTPVIGGSDVARQVFSILSDSLYFVRAEDSEGELLRNDYLSPNFTLGGGVSDRKKEQWTSDLTSDSLVRRLASLTYIAGIHMDPDRPRRDVYSESIEAAKVAREVKSADAAKTAIETYKDSEVRWLKEAAELAARPAGEHAVATTFQPNHESVSDQARSATAPTNAHDGSESRPEPEALFLDMSSEAVAQASQNESDTAPSEVGTTFPWGSAWVASSEQKTQIAEGLKTLIFTGDVTADICYIDGTRFLLAAGHVALAVASGDFTAIDYPAVDVISPNIVESFPSLWRISMINGRLTTTGLSSKDPARDPSLDERRQRQLIRLKKERAP